MGRDAEVPEKTEPVSQTENFILGSVEDVPAQKKFSAKKLIAPIGAIVAVIAIVVAVALNWGPISALFSRESGGTDHSELTNEAYLMKVEQNSFGGYVDALSAAYGQLRSADGEMASDLGMDINITLNVGDTVLDMLEQQFSAQNGQSMDFSWLSEINLALNSDTQGMLQQLKLDLGLANQQILTLCVLQNLSEQTMWLGIPQLSGDFLEMNLEDMGYMMTSVEQQMESQKALLQILPSEDKFNELLDRYIAIVLSHLDEVDRKTETLEVDGLKQECAVLTVKIYEEDALKIAADLLETVKDDADIKQILDNYSAYVNDMMREQYDSYGMEWEDQDFYDDFVDSIEDALDNIEDEFDDLDTETYIQLSTYVDDTDCVIGRHFRVVGEEDAEAWYYMVTEGNVYNFEASILPVEVEITGSGTVKGDLLDAEYTLFLEETGYLVVEIEDVDLQKQAQGEFSGTLRLEPAAVMLEEMFGDAAMSLADVALELKIDSSAESAEMQLNLLTNDTLIIGITICAETSSSDSVDTPSDTVDMMDTDALTDWVENLDFSAILENLRIAGVPEVIISELESGFEAFLEGFTDTGIEYSVPDSYDDF